MCLCTFCVYFYNRVSETGVIGTASAMGGLEVMLFLPIHLKFDIIHHRSAVPSYASMVVIEVCGGGGL